MADRRGISGRALARKANTFGAPTFTIEKAFDSSAEVLNPVPFDLRVLDVLVHCEETNSSGTVKLERSTDEGTSYTDVTGTIVCDTNHEASSLRNADGAGAPATLDDAQRDFDNGDFMRLTPASSAKGTAYILCVRR